MKVNIHKHKNQDRREESYNNIMVKHPHNHRNSHNYKIFHEATGKSATQNPTLDFHFEKSYEML